MRELSAPAPVAPDPETIQTFASSWATMSVEARRSLAAAGMLSAVLVQADKAVAIRAGCSPVTVSFSRRNTVPQLSAKSLGDAR